MRKRCRFWALLLAAAVATPRLAMGDTVPGDSSPSDQDGSLANNCSQWFLLGTALGESGLQEAEMQLLCRQFSAITPENCMKMDAIHPEENRFHFGPADALVSTASAQGLRVNGHALVWHEQCPGWIFRAANEPADRELVLQRLRNHIAAVAGHFAGNVQSWDVVNEAIADGDAYLRDSQWLRATGEDFIAEAFRAARRADPNAVLIYNDYGIEAPPKREKALRLMRDLKQRGAPVDAIGIQGHWQLNGIPFPQIEEAILAFHHEGFEVMITELDIDVVTRADEGANVGTRQRTGTDPYAEGLPSELQQRLALQYGQLFALFRRHQDKIGRVTLWGLHDGRSWLNHWPYQRANHPLLWDRGLRAKPAYAAVLAALQQPSPTRSNP